MTATNKIDVRHMCCFDMDEVQAIESASFEFAWSEADFLQCLRCKRTIGIVAEQSSRVIGFAIYEMHETRLHILNFAVSPDMRLRGAGRLLTERMIGKLKPDRRTRIMLEVRETNLGAQRFFRSMGFRAISILRGFYTESPAKYDEDAYLMQYRLLPIPPVDLTPANRITRLRSTRTEPLR